MKRQEEEKKMEKNFSNKKERKVHKQQSLKRYQLRKKNKLSRQMRITDAIGGG